MVKNRRGFSYLELTMGMSVMLMGFVFYVMMFRSFYHSKENMTVVSQMAQVATNAAETFIVTRDVLKTETAVTNDYPDYIIDVNSVEKPGTRIYMNTIVVTKEANPNGIPPYTLLFYTLDKANLLN